MKTITKISITCATLFISLHGVAANFCPQTIECKIVAPNMQPICAWPMGWSLSAILIGGNIDLNGQTVKLQFTNAQYNSGNSSNCNYSFSNS